jgi:hypothetical protein
MKRKTFHGINGPYLTVYTLVDIIMFGRRCLLCLHNFHRGDEDPDCHDHPFSFFSWLIWGRYREHAEDGSYRDRRGGSVAYRPATHRHRVELLTGSVWTVIFKIDAHREWGFWRGDEFVPWREYIAAKGTTPSWIRRAANMGVYTEADRKLDSVRAYVESAILELNDIVVTRSVSGWDDYNAEYRAKLRQAMLKLEEVRDEIAS